MVQKFVEDREQMIFLASGAETTGYQYAKE